MCVKINCKSASSEYFDENKKLLTDVARVKLDSYEAGQRQNVPTKLPKNPATRSVCTEWKLIIFKTRSALLTRVRTS